MDAAYLQQLFLQVWLPLVLLVAAGGLWARFDRASQASDLRACVNRMVINVFAPPLLFALSAQAEITASLLSVPLIVAASIALNGALLWLLLYRSPVGRGSSRATRAALMLCGMFGNVLFMGLPTLGFVHGRQGESYAAFADVLASTPLLWTLGVWIATRLGQEEAQGHSLLRLMFRLPPVWGFVVGFAVNFLGLQLEPLVQAARFMGQATIPLMLFTLGLAIPWADLRPTGPVMAAVAVKLVFAPLALGLALRLYGQEIGPAQAAALVETAMPTMLMAAALADRFRLDVRAAALTTGWSTLLFMFTLPIWLIVLGG